MDDAKKKKKKQKLLDNFFKLDASRRNMLFNVTM